MKFPAFSLLAGKIPRVPASCALPPGQPSSRYSKCSANSGKPVQRGTLCTSALIRAGNCCGMWRAGRWPGPSGAISTIQSVYIRDPDRNLVEISNY